LSIIQIIDSFSNFSYFHIKIVIISYFKSVKWLLFHVFLMVFCGGKNQKIPKQKFSKKIKNKSSKKNKRKIKDKLMTKQQK